MSIRVTQFHPNRNQKLVLDVVCCGTEIYLDAEYKPQDPRPTEWVRVPESNPYFPLQHLPFRKRFRQVQSVYLDYERVNEFAPAFEFVELLAHDQVVAKHTYQVAPNPYFTREPQLDRAYESLLDFATPDPPGTELEIADGYEVTLLDRSASSLTMGFSVGSLAEILGLKVGIDLKAESSHEQEKREKITHLERKRCTVPERMYAMQSLTTFRFDIGFKCHRTSNHGATWVSTDWWVPVEVWAWHRVYSTMKHGATRCLEIMSNEVETVISPMVRRWLSRKLERAGLDSLSC